MTRWAPFLWLTAVVVVLLLGLARLSSGVVRDGGGASRPPSKRDAADEAIAPPRVSPAPPAPAATPGRTPPSGRDDAAPGRDDGVPGQSLDADEPPGDPALGDPVPPASDPAAATTASIAEPSRVELSTGMLLANVALTQGIVGVVVAAGIWWFEVPGAAVGLTADPWSTGVPALGLGLAFGLALWIGNEVAAGVADAVGAAYDDAVRAMLAPSTLGGWIVLLGVVLPTVAVVEELLFRAALIGVPAAGLGVSPWLLAVPSSVAFAIGHGAQGRVGVAVTGVLGFVLAAGYVLSGSLLVVVAAHYVVNASEFVVHEGAGLDRLFAVGPW